MDNHIIKNSDGETVMWFRQFRKKIKQRKKMREREREMRNPKTRQTDPSKMILSCQASSTKMKNP